MPTQWQLDEWDHWCSENYYHYYYYAAPFWINELVDDSSWVDVVVVARDVGRQPGVANGRCCGPAS